MLAQLIHNTQYNIRVGSEDPMLKRVVSITVGSVGEMFYCITFSESFKIWMTLWPNGFPADKTVRKNIKFIFGIYEDDHPLLYLKVSSLLIPRCFSILEQYLTLSYVEKR